MPNRVKEIEVCNWFFFKSALQIADVAVIGVPDARHGELPRAYIVKANPGTFSSHVFTNPESINVQKYLTKTFYKNCYNIGIF